MRRINQRVIYFFSILMLVLFAEGCTFTENKETGNSGDALVPAVTKIPTDVPIEIPEVSPTAELTEVPTVTTTPFFTLDIQAELSAAENAYQELQQKLLNDDSLTQADMNVLAGDSAVLWEETLDTFWYTLEPLLTSEEVRELHEEQQEWLTMRDTEVQILIDKYEGGSITGLVVGQKKAELTRERTYALADKLTQIVNRMAEAQWQDYSGYYVNTEGTDSVYDELKLELLEDGTYKAEIGLYRLVLLEGTATVYGGILLFEDVEFGVKGNIQFKGDKVIFTVTESDFMYLTPGEGFEFIKSE